MRTGVVGFVNHRLLLLEHRSWDLLACTQTSRLVQLLRSSAYHVLHLLDRLLARLLKPRSWDLGMRNIMNIVTIVFSHTISLPCTVLAGRAAVGRHTLEAAGAAGAELVELVELA